MSLESVTDEYLDIETEIVYDDVATSWVSEQDFDVPTGAVEGIEIVADEEDLLAPVPLTSADYGVFDLSHPRGNKTILEALEVVEVHNIILPP